MTPFGTTSGRRHVILQHICSCSLSAAQCLYLCSSLSEPSRSSPLQVDLCARIREILQNYPEGPSILKELLQNAVRSLCVCVCVCLVSQLRAGDKFPRLHIPQSTVK